ncbi:MAG: GntR family transcriptional regulator [Chloroflexi bacterium]|nr:GntR family transcriptional regulator [Chloroflexota bacterium]
MKVFSQIRPINLREQVADQIRTAIIEGRLKPNDHIAEAALTQQLGVSRTPVREALIILERESLIVSVPNRGCFVRAFNEDDVEALFSMRTTLENFAAELIIDRLSDTDIAHLRDLIDLQRRHIDRADFKEVRSVDMAFHQYLINLSQHPMLMRNWQEIVAQIAAVLYLRAEAEPDYDEYLAIRDHECIVDAYHARNLERVKQENRRINERVAGECKAAVRRLQKRRNGKPRRTRQRLQHPVG